MAAFQLSQALQQQWTLRTRLRVGYGSPLMAIPQPCWHIQRPLRIVQRRHAEATDIRAEISKGMRIFPVWIKNDKARVWLSTSLGRIDSLLACL